MFNKHYINIVEETSGIAANNLGNPLDPNLNAKAVHEIIENYRSHPIKEKLIFDFPEAATEDINKIIKSLNPSKATVLTTYLLR